MLFQTEITAFLQHFPYNSMIYALYSEKYEMTKKNEML